MAEQDKIVKIYDLSVLGEQDTLKALDKINNKFIDIKKNKLSLTSLQASIEDPDELQKIDKQLADLLVSEKKLAVELKQKQVQMKEYQLLAAAEREEKKKQAAGNEALAGSYNDINKKYKELLAISKNTTLLTDPQEVAQAQAELKKYKDLLDNYSRGLTKDGTLVGEYTTGILQAFKNSGLDDVISNQLNAAKKNVSDLNVEFEQLKAELKNIQQTGQGSLSAIEKQMLENRNAAQQFEQQINRVENELRNMNATGSSITSAIGVQFRNLRNDIGGFIIGFVGFQAALGKVQEFVSGAREEFEQAETATARFENRLANLGRSNELDGITATITELVGKFKSLDNDDLTNAAEKLVTYGKVGEDQIKSLLPIIVDFAANARISVQEATDAIVKGLEGNGKALKVYGIDMKDAGNATEAFALIHDVLGAKVRGSAQAFADTSTGALAAQKQALKDQQEQLGAKLLPLLIKLTSVGVAFASMLASIPFGAVATGIGLVAAAWLYYKTQTIAAYIATQASTAGTLLNRAAIFAENAALVLSNAVKTTASTITWLYVAAQVRLAAATGATAVVTRVLAAAIAFLSSPIGIVIGLTAALVTVFGVLSAKASTTQTAIDNYNKRLRESAAAARIGVEVNEKINKSTSDTIALLKTKAEIAKNENLTMATRKKAMEDIVAVDKQFFKGLTLNNIATAQGVNLIQAYINKLMDKAKAEAYAQLITEKQKKLLEAQAKEDQIKIKFGNRDGGVTDNRTFGQFLGDLVTRDNSRDPFALLKEAQAEVQNLTDDINVLNKIAANSPDIQKALLNQNTPTGVPTVTLTGGDKKPTEPKKVNRVEDLKKVYEAEKAELNAQHEDRKISDDKYYADLEAKADLFRNNKLKAIAKLNAEELQTQKEFDSLLAKEKNDALDKQYELELKALQRNRNQKTTDINNSLADLSSDRSLTDTERLEKKIEFDNQLLDAQVDFNKQADLLELKYKIRSTENADDRAQALKEVQQRLGEDLLALQEANFAKLQDEQVQQLRAIQSRITNSAIGVLTDSNLSSNQKTKRLKKIEDDGAKELAEARLNQIDIELEADQKLFEQKIISQKEYNDRVAALESERLQLHKNINEQEVAATQKKNEDKQKLEDAAFQIASKLIDAYIQNLYAEVEANYKAAQDKNKIDEERRLAQAQSKAEEETIKREYDEKEKEAERKRNKERQDVARKQLAIEFAIASIKALSTSTTFVDGLAKEAIAFAEYVAALSLLNKQQFAFGGLVKAERLTDGLVKAAPNVAPTVNGDNVLAYVKPGEVILNEKQQAALGGAATFASIGVPGFGSSVQPPVFRSYTSTASNGFTNNHDFDQMKQLFYGLASLIEAEAIKPVILNPNDVGNALAKKMKNVDLATI